MRRNPFKKRITRVIALLLALMQCVAVSGCGFILENGRADLPMAPSVAIPIVNTGKTVEQDPMKKYNIGGTDAFYLLPGIESDPEEMTDFQCFDYTSDGDFFYMYSAPSYIEGEKVSAYKGTKGTAPAEGSVLPDREGGILCNAMIVMTYNPYTRAYHVIDAQVYPVADDKTRLTGLEFYECEGYYMLSNAYGGKLGDQERYYVVDRKGTSTVYDSKGNVVFISSIGTLLRTELDKVIYYNYLGGNAAFQKEESMTDEEKKEREEAQKEVALENSLLPEEDRAKDPEQDSDNYISERAREAGVNVLLKSAVMDANFMTYASVMLYDRPSPWDPDATLFEEVISCYSVPLDSEYMKYISYNKNWPKQITEWMKLDGRTIRMLISDETDSVASMINDIARDTRGNGLTMGDLLNSLSDVRNLVGMDVLKSSTAHTVNVQIAEDLLNIQLADVRDDYSPFIMGSDTGFPSFICGWVDAGNQSCADLMQAYQDEGYEILQNEELFIRWMQQDYKVILDKYNQYLESKHVTKKWKRVMREMLQSLTGVWSLFSLVAARAKNELDGSQLPGLSYDFFRKNVGKIKINMGNEKQVTDMSRVFRRLWNNGLVTINQQKYQSMYFWFNKYGYRKVSDQTIFLTGLTNNFKRSYYAGAYGNFHRYFSNLPNLKDYSAFEVQNTGTGYDNLADGRLYFRMSQLQAAGLVPKPGEWNSKDKTNTSPFTTDNVEMLLAYHESQIKGHTEETGAMVCEIPTDAPPLKWGKYPTATMKPYEYNEELSRKFYIDFSQVTKFSTRFIKDLNQQESPDSAFWSVAETHWRDALRIYLQDRVDHGDTRLLDHLSAAMKSVRDGYQNNMYAAIADVNIPDSDFEKSQKEIGNALIDVARNDRSIEDLWKTYQKKTAAYNDARRGGGRASGEKSEMESARGAYLLALSQRNVPIEALEEPERRAYDAFVAACAAHGLKNGFTVDPGTEGEVLQFWQLVTDGGNPALHYKTITAKSFSGFGTDFYLPLYFDEDGWWDDNENWAGFVQNVLIASGSYTDEEIGDILKLHEGVVPVVEVIPAKTYPVSYRLILPSGSTASFANVANQQGSATTAPADGAILFHNVATTDKEGNHHFTSNIDYVFPTLKTSQGRIINLATGMTNGAKGLVDRKVPGCAIDAGYIGYDGPAGKSQIIALATDEGVKFYNGTLAQTVNGRDWYSYSVSDSTYITNVDLLTSSGYTPSVQEQTAAAMTEKWKYESPDKDDKTTLDADGRAVTGEEQTPSVQGSADEGSKDQTPEVKTDAVDEGATKNIMGQEYVQNVLNSARVGTLKAISSFTMTGKDEILISAYDTGLSLYNTRSQTVVPVANGSYYQSFPSKNQDQSKNQEETEQILQEQEGSTEQSYKVLGFNTEEYEYGNLDLARAKVYDLDLAGGKSTAYELAVKQELAQRAVDYIRLPLRTRVDDEGKIVKIDMSDEEKEGYEESAKLFSPASEQKEWVGALSALAQDVGLLRASDGLVSCLQDLRGRVAVQQKAVNEIYALLGRTKLSDEEQNEKQAYWNNVALRLSIVGDRDALESMLVEIRMQEDVAKHLDQDTRKRYEEYREILNLSEEQGAVELPRVETVIEEAGDDLSKNPTTNAEILKEGIEENGNAHDYLNEALGRPEDNENRKRAAYQNEVLDDIKNLLEELHRNRLKESGKTPAEDYDETVELWLTELNPDNFLMQNDSVLTDFIRMLNMADGRISEKDQKQMQEREDRVREALPKISSMAEIEELIISEQILLGTYSKYAASYKAWKDQEFETTAQRVAVFRQSEWYREIITAYRESEEVQAFLKKQVMTWEEYLTMIIRVVGRGAIYDDSGKATGTVLDVDEAIEYYTTHGGTMEGYEVTADIGIGGEDQEETAGDSKDSETGAPTDEADKPDEVIKPDKDSPIRKYK
ncbi:MAG: hypothetical protein K5696_12955 [Lachnospiraceae bacterium]|nr:hypothetical protein [Lachnospiraceae bacterium]